MVSKDLIDFNLNIHNAKDRNYDYIDDILLDPHSKFSPDITFFLKDNPEFKLGCPSCNDSELAGLYRKVEGNDNKDLYFLTIRTFLNEDFISPASIQRLIKVSYIRASAVLDRLINDGLVSEKVGTFPCRVFKRKMKKKYKNICN